MATSLNTDGPPSTRFLRFIGAQNQNGISIGLAIFAQMTAECPYTLQWDAVFAGLTSVTDRQTMLLGW